MRNNAKQSDYIVIGGGISGLAAAYRLRRLRPEAQVTLLEADARVGGKLVTERVDGFVIEGSADSFLSRKPRAIALVEELGLADHVQGRIPEHRKTYVQRHGALHRLPEGLSGLIPTDLAALQESTLLSAAAVARIAREPHIPPRTDDGDESVAAFVTRRLGQEAFEDLIEPLLAGIYGGRADLLSVQAVFPQLRRLEQQHGSLLRGLAAQPAPAAATYPPFVSLRGGLQTLVDALAAHIGRTNLHCATPVTQLERHADGWRVDDRRADAVVVALPATAAARLLAPVDAALAAQLGGIDHSAAALVTLAYPAAAIARPLDGYGYIVPRAEGKAILACTWTSNKWDGRAPGGSVLLRVFIGRYGDDVTRFADARLLAMAQEEVTALFGISAEPTLTRIHRWPNAIPQYTLGHRERLAAIYARVAQLPGLALAGAYFTGVGIPDCIASGEQAAHAVVEIPMATG